MKLGNKIFELRKKDNMTQEELAEKLGVTRQTISKWELDETSPDIKQAKEISNIFKVSLDELLDNDIQDLLIQRVSNTEQLAGMVIKILKVIGILMAVFFVMCIVLFIFFTVFRRESSSGSTLKSAVLNCSIEDNNYTITLGENEYYNCPECDKQMNVYLKDITDWANLEHSVTNVETYFKENGGSCIQE